MKKVDACNLSESVSKLFGHDINIPYLFMQDQRLVEVDVCEATPEEEQMMADFEATGVTPNDLHQFVQAALNVACSRKMKIWHPVKGWVKFKEGFYLLSFQD